MIIDITPPVSASLPVWPGDCPFEREIRMEIAKGDPVNLTSLRMSPHLGAHADAPWHYGDAGRTIDEQDLEIYVGACQVVRIDAKRRQAIRPEQVDSQLRRLRHHPRDGELHHRALGEGNFAASQYGHDARVDQLELRVLLFYATTSLITSAPRTPVSL